MSSDILALEAGDQIVVDKDNADTWAPIIGQPLADAIKKAEKPGRLLVTSVDHVTRTITLSRIKE